LAFIGYRINVKEKVFILVLLFSPVFALIDSSLLSYFQIIDIKQMKAFNPDSEELLNVKVPAAIWLFTLIFSSLMFYGSRLGLVSWGSFSEKYFPAKSIIMSGAFFACSFFWMATSVRLMDRVGFYFIPLLALFCAWILGSKRKKYGEWLVFLIVLFVLILAFLGLNRGFLD
jgi:hypothetical protein